MEFLSQVLESIKSHSHILFTGVLGATFGFLLSKEPARDRWIGFLPASFYVWFLLNQQAYFLQMATTPNYLVLF